jgi:hypothetical protein
MQNFYSIFSFGFFFADFSISEIATDFGLDLAGGLKEGAVNFTKGPEKLCWIVQDVRIILVNRNTLGP